jgi:hypothetical protein
MFKLQKIIATSLPGPLGLQKNLASVKKNDARIREFLEQLPPELHISENYTPLFGESPLGIIRRYAIICLLHGHLLTLHRPYTSKSDFSKEAAMTAAWTLSTYQNQMIALSQQLEPYIWFIEEFLDVHSFRATMYLGGNLLRNPENPRAATIFSQIQLCRSQARAAAMRKRDFAKVYGMFESLERLLGGTGEEFRPIAEIDAEKTDEQASQGPGTEGLWDMGEILTEGAFRWDDFLVDMI